MDSIIGEKKIMLGKNMTWLTEVQARLKTNLDMKGAIVPGGLGSRNQSPDDIAWAMSPRECLTKRVLFLKQPQNSRGCWVVKTEKSVYCR